MELLIADFHFIRPFWLLIIIPALILIVLLMKQKNKQGQWHQIFPAHLANLLIETKSVVHKKKSMVVLVLSSFIIAIALAGPTWQRVEQPLFKIKKAQVVIMDMSLSMYATDLLPNRLTRAKFKLNDLVSRLGEGDTALIAYAGDAFVISPMTQDVANLKNLIPALSPDIMPVYGSSPAYAIEKTLELFKQANHYQGDIYLLTDGMEGSDAREITQLLQGTQFTLSIMGIGTAQGAPIKLPNDQLLKDDSGNIVIPKLQSSLLRGLSNKLNGRYSNLTNDTSDIDYLTSIPQSGNLDNQEQENQFGDQWHEVGPYLILLLLPFAALAFRRGVLMSAVIIAAVFNPFASSPVMAKVPTQIQQPVEQVAQTVQAPLTSWWDDLWETKNQQALNSYKSNRFDQAASTFEDPKWRGASHYKQGNYEQALNEFNRENTPSDLFNQGNTLAKMEQFEESIKRFEKLLKQVPDFPNAQENLDLVKELAQQKQEQEKQQGEQSGDSSDNQEQSDKESKDDQKQSDSDENKQGDQKDKQSDDSKSKPSDSDNKDDSDQQDNNESEDKSGEKSDKDSGEQPPLTEEEKEQQKKQLEKQQQEAKESQQLFNNENLTPDQLQRLNQLVKKIPDNPSLLLQQKMKNEARKRQHMRVTTKERKQW